MPLPIPPGNTKHLERRMEKAVKGILPPTFKVFLKTYYSLPARQALVHPKHSEISPFSQSPMPYTKPKSLGDGHTKSASFEAQADGWNEEQLETFLTVQPDGMTGKHRDGEQNPLEQAQVSEDEDKVVTDGIPQADQGGNFFFQAEVDVVLEASRVAARHFRGTAD